MANRKTTDPDDALRAHLAYLKLSFVAENYLELAQHATDEHLEHLTFLARLLEGEVLRRQNRSVERRIRLARFPVPKTLEQFDWSWPKKINRLQVQNLFRLNFIEQHANVVFVGGVGLGKSHLVQLKTELRKYLRPRLLVLDELGYLPIDKTGADLLFQIISQRYERGSTAITTNRIYKKWATIFNNDATLTSAVLDRLLHHAETVRIEGKSYRMKDPINDPADTPNSDSTTEQTADESTD